MQIEGPNSSSNPLVDRRLNERGVHDKSPTDNRQMHPNAAETPSRSLGEIVVSLHSDLAMELPKYPGFTAREQGAAPTADLLPQQQSSGIGSDWNSAENPPKEQSLGGSAPMGEAEAARAADKPTSATDQKSDGDSGGQIIDEVA
jgi:hypothetical protein